MVNDNTTVRTIPTSKDIGPVPT